VRVYRGSPQSDSGAASRRPCALTIGNFDGVHRGHQALLTAVRAAADRLGLEAAVMTFEPHPREYFATRAGDVSQAPARIAGLRDKLEALAAYGIDRVIVEHFNESFARMPAKEFVTRLLVAGCRARWIMVGEDFRFGAGRSGDASYLRDIGQTLGFEACTLPTITHGKQGEGGERVSSSAVRKALATGNLEHAAGLLGRPYIISGRVVHGAKLGRTLGFPTANLRIAHGRPALSGIFIVRVHGVAEHPLPGVASLGLRPTVDDSGRVLLETHIFDFAGHLYGRLIRVEFVKKLRDEEKYSDLPTLTAAIAGDARQARQYFGLPLAEIAPPSTPITTPKIVLSDRIS